MVPPSFFPPRAARKEQTMKKQNPAHLPTPEEDTRIAMYREIVDDMLDAYQEQYHDYGRGYAEARRKIPCYIAGKLYDKVSQLIALTLDGETDLVFSAAVDNALRDLADCALTEYVERRIDEDAIQDF